MTNLQIKMCTSLDEPELIRRQKGLQRNIQLVAKHLDIESGVNLLSYLFKELGDVETALRRIERSKKRMVQDHDDAQW